MSSSTMYYTPSLALRQCVIDVGGVMSLDELRWDEGAEEKMRNAKPRGPVPRASEQQLPHAVDHFKSIFYRVYL
jgi:hypothetical protein